MSPIAATDMELFQDFYDEASEMLGDIDSLLVELEEHPDDLEIVNAVFRPVHSIKGNAPFFGLNQLRNLAHDLETLLDNVRQKKLVYIDPLPSIVLKGVDAIRNSLERVHSGGAEFDDLAAYEALLAEVQAGATQEIPEERRWQSFSAAYTALQIATKDSDELLPLLKNLYDSALHLLSSEGQQKITNPEARETKVASETAVQKKETQKKENSTEKEQHETHKTMRVDESDIDSFLSQVGELLIIGEMLNHIERKLLAREKMTEVLAELRTLMDDYSRLSHNLQDSVMAIRRVPVQSVLKKYPRLVRDIAKAKEKQIHVKIEGEELSIDKSLVELLDAPLTHMIRNAADHGIETPAAREAAGKDPQGLITLDVSETEAFTTLAIVDDGAGINLEKIREKAEELGLVEPGATMTEDDVVNFMFQSGVSTAETVTDISGRGVGMDVVKQSIEAAGGKITVSTEPGKGSRFTIHLAKAVSTQIVESLIFEIDSRCFVIPVDRVDHVFRCNTEEVFDTASEQKFLFRNGKMLPIVPASTLFQTSRPERDFEEEETFVAVQINKKDYALWIDDIVGVQQVVVKHVGSFEDFETCFVGAALNGDGRIALIIDLEDLCSNYDIKDVSRLGVDTTRKTISANHDVDALMDENTRELLLARANGSTVGFYLDEIVRLERISSANIEHSTGVPCIQLNGQILPVVDSAMRDSVHHDATELGVLIAQSNNTPFGILVDEILDIIHLSTEVETFTDSKRVLGSAIIRGECTDIINVEALAHSSTAPTTVKSAATQC